jgi:hypothetical protein
MYFFAWAAPEQQGQDSGCGRKKTKSEKSTGSAQKSTFDKLWSENWLLFLVTDLLNFCGAPLAG